MEKKYIYISTRQTCACAERDEANSPDENMTEWCDSCGGTNHKPQNISPWSGGDGEKGAVNDTEKKKNGVRLLLRNFPLTEIKTC